jgi:hypothetical protein
VRKEREVEFSGGVCAQAREDIVACTRMRSCAKGLCGTERTLGQPQSECPTSCFASRGGSEQASGGARVAVASQPRRVAPQPPCALPGSSLRVAPATVAFMVSQSEACTEMSITCLPSHALKQPDRGWRVMIHIPSYSCGQPTSL